MNAPFNPGRATLRDPFSAFLSDLDSEDVVRATALSFGLSGVTPGVALPS